MNPLDDGELLAAYATRNSEEAFTELVGRYVGLVYSSALRQVREPQLAKEVTQAVFILLARKARVLSHHVTLSGWLCRVAYFVSRDALRAERRRHYREQISMQIRNHHEDTSWSQIAPLLDEAVAQLGEKDRNAIVSRFYEQKSLQEVGSVLGVDADAAQKRVSRALERLRKFFIKRGVVSTTAIIAGAISANSVQAAPAGLVASISTSALTGAAKGTGTLTILKIMAATNLKSAAVTAVIVAASILTPLLLQHQAQAHLHDQDASLLQQSNQLAQLTTDNQRLASQLNQTNSRPAADPQLAELLKLRSEVGRLQRTVAEMSTPKTLKEMTSEERLAFLKQKYANQVARLKDWLATHPSEKIPELDHISEGYWIDAVDTLERNDNFERAMSSLRANAELKTFSQLRTALKQYLKDNNNQFPADLSQLTPYLKTPIDDATLQRYEIVPANTLVTNLQPGSDLVITQVAPANPALDTRSAYGLDQQGHIVGRMADERVANRWNSIR